MPQPMPDRLAFDDVVIDFAGRRVSRGGTEQTLEPKAFAVLALLVGAPGRVFTRDEILDAVWQHRHVTQSVLNRIMSLLRQALGEDAQSPRLLHTVHGVGYRFDLPARAPAPTARAVMETPVRQNRRGLAALLAVATIGAVVVAIAVMAWLPEGASPEIRVESVAAKPTTRPSLAVLPFADLSPARDQEYLADGLAGEILNQLAQISLLRIVGRSSSFSFRGRSEDLRVIGQKLGVAHLLEGSVSKVGEQLRITAQLVRADDGSQLWSKSYARELRDVFAVQDEIARDVAQALSVKLEVVTFNREQGGTTNVEAYERYLRWRNIVMQELYDFAHDRERLQLAREMVALDPGCVLCRDALAVSLNAMAQEVGGVQADQLRAEARETRRHIATTAPDSWVARRDRSNQLWVEGRRAEAIALAKEIADSGPQTKERVWDYAYMIYAMGHLNETVTLVEQVRAVEPMALFLSRDLQFDYTAARRYQDAEAEYQRGLKLQGSQKEPHFVAFFRQLAGQRPGDLEDLRELHALMMRETVYGTPMLRDLGRVLGDRGAMLALARKAVTDENYGGEADDEYAGFVADALGDADLVVAALRKVLERQKGFEKGAMTQFPYVALWNVPYSHARAHPEFKRLLVEAGVADYWRQTGKWGDGCAPVGPDDFQCQ
jgi:TolB-like protein/DNA-binding winged helix-turn-helix (wHTH) protein